MFQNIIRWTFKIAVGEVEKEIHVLLEGDTPIQAVEQVAMQMIAHCSKVKEQQAAQAAPAPEAAPDIQPVQEAKAAE